MWVAESGVYTVFHCGDCRHLMINSFSFCSCLNFSAAKIIKSLENDILMETDVCYYELLIYYAFFLARGFWRISIDRILEYYDNLVSIAKDGSWNFMTFLFTKGVCPYIDSIYLMQANN